MQPDPAASVSTRRPHRRWLLVAAVATALLAAGCEVQFHVSKEVTGGSSSGPFTVHIDCPQDPPAQDLVFNGAESHDSTVFSYDISETCTITEPDSAGATTVTISCVSPPSGITCSAPGPTLTVIAPTNPETWNVDIKVVNDFTPTTTTTTAPFDPGASVNAGAVESAPDFTG